MRTGAGSRMRIRTLIVITEAEVPGYKLDEGPSGS